MNNKWDKRFMALAHHFADWSKDPSTKVGAVITVGNRILSQGYNGPAAFLPDDPNASRDQRLARTVHAELNAILHAKQDLRGATLYTTHCPCASCTVAIITAGIARVVMRPPSVEFGDRWESNTSMAMLMEAGIVYNVVNHPQLYRPGSNPPPPSEPKPAPPANPPRATR